LIGPAVLPLAQGPCHGWSPWKWRHRCNEDLTKASTAYYTTGGAEQTGGAEKTGGAEQTANSYFKGLQKCE